VSPSGTPHTLARRPPGVIVSNRCHISVGGPTRRRRTQIVKPDSSLGGLRVRGSGEPGWLVGVSQSVVELASGERDRRSDSGRYDQARPGDAPGPEVIAPSPQPSQAHSLMTPTSQRITTTMTITPTIPIPPLLPIVISLCRPNKAIHPSDRCQVGFDIVIPHSQPGSPNNRCGRAHWPWHHLAGR
jgi:hypothetical protein